MLKVHEMKTVIATSYTPKYLPQVHNLSNSLTMLGLELVAYPYESADALGWLAWMQNCHMSMHMLRHAMVMANGDPVLFVDADSTFERTPDLIPRLEESSYDAAFYWMPDNGWLANGTIWMRNNEKCIKFMDLFLNQADRVLRKWLSGKPSPNRRPGRHAWEQTVLHDGLRKWTGQCDLKFAVFPDSYCLVFDRKAQDHMFPVIQHWQASRTLGSKA